MRSAFELTGKIFWVALLVLAYGQTSVAQTTIDDIRLRGNDHVNSAAILEVISSRPGREASESAVARDVHAIYGLGSFTDVRPRLFRDDNGLMILEFTVQENPVVERLEFEGIELATPEELSAVMSSRPGEVLNFNTVGQDRASLERYYSSTLGYPHPAGHVRGIEFQDGALVVKLQESFLAQSFSIEGVTSLDAEALRSRLLFEPGQPVTTETLDQNSELITAEYDEMGYALSGLSHRLEEETQTVVYVVQELQIEDVRVVGNGQNRTAAILRRVRSKPGQPLSPERLRKDMDRLRDSGLFRSVQPEFDQGERAGGQIVTLEVEEEKTRAVMVGAGFQTGEGDASSGLSGQISVNESSLWGSGQSVGASWTRGENQSSLNASWSNPAWNENGDGVGLSLYKAHYDNLQQSADEKGNKPLYEDDRTGGVLSYSRPLTDWLGSSVALRYEDVAITQEEDSPAAVTGTGQGILSSVTVAANYDSTDDPRRPTLGSRLQVAATGGAGEFSYTKVEGRGDRIIPLGGKTQLYVAGGAGVINGDAPAGELFNSGGPRAMRAYEPASFYGDRMVYGLAEYRFPLTGFLPIQGVVFAELGNAWYKDAPTKLAGSSGVGTRLAIPQMGLGDLQLNYAWGREGGRFSLGVGKSF